MKFFLTYVAISTYFVAGVAGATASRMLSCPDTSAVTHIASFVADTAIWPWFVAGRIAVWGHNPQWALQPVVCRRTTG